MSELTKGILCADNVEVTVTNTSAYTQVFQYNIPASTLTGGQMLRLGIRGLCSNGTGSSKALSAKVEINDGTTTVYVEADGMYVFAGTREVSVDSEFLAMSTAQQRASVFIRQASHDAGSNDENFLFNATLLPAGSIGVDTTKSVSVKVFVKPSAASSSLTFVKYWAFVELV